MRSVEKWLLKKAKGFHYSETVEEYQDVDGEMKLVRRKVSKKYSPPDVAAIKAAGESERGLSDYSDFELERLREELIAKGEENETDANNPKSEM